MGTDRICHIRYCIGNCTNTAPDSIHNAIDDICAPTPSGRRKTRNIIHCISQSVPNRIINTGNRTPDSGPHGIKSTGNRILNPVYHRRNRIPDPIPHGIDSTPDSIQHRRNNCPDTIPDSSDHRPDRIHHRSNDCADTVPCRNQKLGNRRPYLDSDFLNLIPQPNPELPELLIGIPEINKRRH